jgi:hypothetical protein
MTHPNRRKSYWAKDLDPELVVRKLMEGRTADKNWNNTPLTQTVVRNNMAYYSNVLEPSAWDTSLVFAGEQGELVKMFVPQARSLIRDIVTIVTKEKLSFNALAERRGTDVVQETRLGNSLSNQIVDDEGVDQKGSILTEQALVDGLSFLKSSWQTDKGQLWTSKAGRGLYSGGIQISNLSILDVRWNWRMSDWQTVPWAEAKVKKNRWDLVAQFPKLSREIQALPPADDSATHESGLTTVDDDDMVNVYEFYHRPCAAMPNGRMLFYSDQRTIYHDGKNEYGSIPIEPMIPERINKFLLGHPMFSNLLPAQEMLDHGFSAIATNQSAFAVQNILSPRGANLSVHDIAGMNFISYTPQNIPGGGKPEAMQLTQSAPETFKFIDLLHSHMQQIAKISGALRGAPPPGVTSGTAIATLTTNAIEFISSTAGSYKDCIERTMMHSVNGYRKFATVKHIVFMAGRGFETYKKTFVGKDLDPITKIKLVRSNPLMQTVTGRSDLADRLVKNKLVKSTKDYVGVLEGEPLNKLYATELSESDLIESENELLTQGKGLEEVPVLASDDHPEHLRKHSALLNDPYVRTNSNRTKAVTDHMFEHYSKAKDTDPFLMAMIRTGMMPEGGPPPPPGAGPGGPGPSGPQRPPQLPGDAGPGNQPAAPAQDLLQRNGGV